MRKLLVKLVPDGVYVLRGSRSGNGQVVVLVCDGLAAHPSTHTTTTSTPGIGRSFLYTEPGRRIPVGLVNPRGHPQQFLEKTECCDFSSCTRTGD